MDRPRRRAQSFGMPLPALPVTSSWSTRLPAAFARIGISRGPPRSQSGYRMYRPLAPGSYFKSVPVPEYRERYMADLAKLDPARVLAELDALADGRKPALLCFEPPDPDSHWCHRGYVSAWLADTLGLEVFEVGQEAHGCGWAHPKLPPEYRRAPPRGRRKS
jgi:hypothetical protein